MTDRAEDLVLAVLNSTPTVDGTRRDLLEDEGGAELARGWGGSGGALEREAAQRARAAVQQAVLDPDAAELSLNDAGADGLLDDVAQRPRLTASGLRWDLHTPPENELAVRFLQAWTDVAERWPGRLRACANTECTLFLLDRSRAGNARWCSMASCGNRLKARRHHERSRSAGSA